MNLQGRSKSIALSDGSQVGEARRAAAQLAANLRFDGTQSGQAAIVATELAGNIIRHAQRGEIVFRVLTDGDNQGLEMLALDKGPGMKDVTKCLSDGYSTAGSPGTGLGSVQRLSTQFDVFSAPGRGAALLSQIWRQPLAGKSSAQQSGVVCLPKEGEHGCGDAWAARNGGPSCRLIVVDGLGHGLLAADAADESLRVFQGKDFADLKGLMHYLHGALQKTRGAAVALLDFEASRPTVRFLGVGNIAGVITHDGATKSVISWNGTVGHVLHKAEEIEYKWLPGALLVLFSDGLGTKWKLEDYPGLQTRHPSLIAGVLYRDHARGRDDVTVFVKRNKP